jgi:hypothetical protein
VKEDQLTYLVSLFDGTQTDYMYIDPQNGSHIHILNLLVNFQILKWHLIPSIEVAKLSLD